MRTSFLLSVAAVSASLVVVALRPDRLYVEHVVFEGANRAAPGELRHLADVVNGTTMWGVDVDRVAAGVTRHPWVRSARVERRWPVTVAVHVEEHVPAALLAFEGGLVYVDADGTPFLRASADDLDHPVITGIDPELGSRHPALPRLAARDALWLLEALQERALLPRDRVSEVAFHPLRGYTVRLSGGSAESPASEVLFAVGAYERQLDRLAALLDRGVDLSGSVHVDLGPERVAIVRPVDRSVPSEPSVVPSELAGVPPELAEALPFLAP